MKHKLFSLLSFFPITLFSQPWQQDLTFDDDGIVITDIDAINNRVYGIIPNSNGEIIAVGSIANGINYEIGFAKYQNDGSLDISFGTEGILVDNSTPNPNFVIATAQQPDGKILVCGSESNALDLDMFVSRYNENGEVDVSFGNSGYFKMDLDVNVEEFSAIAVQPDGKIIAAGKTYESDLPIGIVVRLDSDGSLDESFGNLGVLRLSIVAGGDYLNSIAIQEDGKIVIAGYGYTETDVSDFICARLQSNGDLDNTFNGDGTFTYDYGAYEYAKSIFIQTDGKIVLGGYTSPDVWDHTLIIRLLENGNIDNTFGDEGVFYQTQSRCTNLIGNENTIIVGGANFITSSNMDFSLFALTMEGKLDTTFCSNNFINTDLGSFIESPSCLVFQNEQTILMGGGTSNTQNFGIVRYFTSATPITENIVSEVDVLKIYPNPVSEICTLITDQQLESGFIVDACGKTVAQIKLINEGLAYTIKIPDEIAPGNYFLILRNERQFTAVPFIK
jgi:uncharacterized delta-60 repeat protein